MSRVRGVVETVTLLPRDEVHIRVDAAPGPTRELSDALTFEVPGARYTPAFRRGGWDGTLRLLKRGLVYAGLAGRVRELCDELGYEVSTPLPLPGQGAACPLGEIGSLVESLGLPADRAPRDYQLAALRECASSGRALVLSPTASGKSLIIYSLCRMPGRSLVIVPTINLVEQMVSDFRSYGFAGGIRAVRGGESPHGDAECPVVVSTWQSASRVEDRAGWMNQFSRVVVDECHLAKSKSICGLMEAATLVRERYGFTGTLDGIPTNEMVLEGLFGPVVRLTTTRELMDRGLIARARVRVLTLRHPDAARRALTGAKYADEIKYLVGCAARNRFVANLALALEGPTLVLFTRVEQHGAVLHSMIAERAGGRPTRFVHGGVDAEDREEVRRVIAEHENPVVCASYGVYQLGVNAPRLRNVVFASPYKSRVVVAQSIGRGLRLADGKTECDVYDVADDLSWRRRRNHTLRHAEQRLALYAREQLDYRVVTVDLPPD